MQSRGLNDSPKSALSNKKSKDLNIFALDEQEARGLKILSKVFMLENDLDGLRKVRRMA